MLQVTAFHKQDLASLLRTAKEAVRPYYLRWAFFPLFPEKQPAAFVNWRDFPSRPLDECDESFFPPAATEAADFIILPMADWHGPLQRPQQLAKGLARLGHRCVYVNPHLGRERRVPFPWSDRAMVTQLEDGIFEMHCHLVLEPVFHQRPLWPAEAELISGQILDLLRRMGSRQQIIIEGFPVWTGVARGLQMALGAQLIYDCHDLIDGFPNVGEDLLALEGTAMANSDVVLFSADWLMNEQLRRHPQLQQKSLLLRNAVDPQFFLPGRSNCGNARPRIGYVGSISGWFNQEWLSFAAAARPDWEFTIIGPCSDDFDRGSLGNCENVVFGGEVPYAAVPHWLSTFDVAIIPFRIEPLTLGTNPIKLYEYFACGLPVVSSHLPEVERYGAHVYLAASPAEFVARIEQALNEDNAEARSGRRKIAEAETWDERCRTLLETTERVAPVG